MSCSIIGLDKKWSMGRISGSAQPLKSEAEHHRTDQNTVNVGFNEIGLSLTARIHSLGNPK
jgi:hypothetical protein